jgi:hypothetical protein
MDPSDHLRALRDGVRCTVCEGPVPPERIRLLAWRDDLAFLEVSCDACRSTSLGFAIGPSARGAAGPITSDDVLDAHLFLATWRGDLVGLFGDRRGSLGAGR